MRQGGLIHPFDEASKRFLRGGRKQKERCLREEGTAVGNRILSLTVNGKVKAIVDTGR